MQSVLQGGIAQLAGLRVSSGLLKRNLYIYIYIISLAVDKTSMTGIAVNNKHAC